MGIPVFLLVTMVSSAAGDFTSMIRKITMDRLELEVQIGDETGTPLAGAIVWYIGMPVRAESGLALNAAILSRMAQRYAKQSDFLGIGDVPGAIFERTDLNGVYRDFRETGGIPDKKYPYIVVATKRGYLPQVTEGVAPLNQRHVVSFKLQHDPQAVPEPRMEDFDRIMAQTRPSSSGEDPVGEARMHRLDELQQRARKLAEMLEKDGLDDQSSAVYWALADFPDVIRVTSPDGSRKIVGYRNGRDDPQSEEDRTHAIRLNTHVPKLLLDKMLMAQGFSGKGIHDSRKGLAYLNVFNQLVSGPKGESVLPSEFRVAIQQTLRWGTPDQVCDTVQRTHRLEAATMPVPGWWHVLRDLQKKREKLNLPLQTCIIDGLPEQNVEPVRQ